MIARAARVEDAEWSLFGSDVTMTSFEQVFGANQHFFGETSFRHF
jgi:hypothetical protein